MEWISLAACVCQTLKLGLDEIVNLECKIRQNDLSVCLDLKQHAENIKKYNKHDQKIIQQYFLKYLNMNIDIATKNNTVNNSCNATIRDDVKD